jgi:hypothetical protein
MTDAPWMKQGCAHCGNPTAVGPLLTPKESAAYRRCSVRKQDRERAEGRGPPFVRDDGRIFYRLVDLDRFIEAHLRPGEFGGTENATGPQVHNHRPQRNARASAVRSTTAEEFRELEEPPDQEEAPA